MKMQVKKYLDVKIIATLLVSMASALSLRAQTNVVPDDMEFQVLKSLFDNTAGASWINKTNWPAAGSWPATATAAQMGTWYGITVTNGDISKILLPSNNLTGPIPTTLSQLSQLTQLQLYGNKLNASIPPSLGSLNKLTSLRLDANKLTGNIPPEIGNLSNLQGLHLFSNQLSGTIPDEIGNLSVLVTLDLHGNQLSGPIPGSIGNLTKLQTLHLYSNQLTGSIPIEIGNLINLTVLQAYANQLTGSIPIELGGLTNLVTLQLYSNQLSGTIPSSIRNLIKLQTLNLFTNQLTGNVPIELENLNALVTLQLHNNQLTGPIPDELSHLSNLTVLNLGNNQLTGLIPSSLGNLTKLTTLYLYKNQLSGEIPSTLGALSKLKYLYLYANKLTGQIPTTFSGLVSINNFYVYANQLTGNLPDISNWPNISIIDVSDNFLKGDVPSVANCPNLTTFTAANNQFNSLPVSLLSLSLLLSVDFTNNALAFIPDFSNQLNKANLTLKLSKNSLDYSKLEPIVGVGIKLLTYSPQNNIHDIITQVVTLGVDLVIIARPRGLYTSNIKWEQLQPNGSWQDISSGNADPLTGATYRIVNANTSAEGKYRWSCTSTKATAFTLISDPIEIKTPERATLDNFGFQYQYDERNRMTGKKVPGAGWVYMVYDLRDRLVLSQDANQRQSNQWMFTKYDILNRPVMTGIYTHTGYASQAAMQALISTTNFYEMYDGSFDHGYSNKVFPTANLEILTVTYYDNYNFKTNWGTEYAYAPNQVAPVIVNEVTYSQPSSENLAVIGQVTGTKIKSSASDPYWMQTVNYYDNKYRIVQTKSDNFKGGIDVITTLFDFVGKPLGTQTIHSVNSLAWQNMVATKVVGSNLSRNGGSGGWGNSGASSVQQIPSGTDGWLEATVTNVNNTLMFGLSDQDTDQNYNSIDYAFSIGSSILRVYKNGILKSTVAASLVMGDMLRIARENGNIVFYRNGVKVYPTGTTTLPCSTQLMADVSFNAGSSSLGHTRMSVSGGEVILVNRKFDYDHAGRVLKTYHQVNSNPEVLLGSLRYNEIGQLVEKNLHSTDGGSTFKQSLDARYNIRGWLTSINNSQLTNDGGTTNDDNNDLFGIQFGYNNDLGTGSTPQYNSNISAVKWSKNLALGTAKDAAYNFTYDAMSRITGASYLTNTSNVWSNATNTFSESGYTYDENGNVMGLTRKGVGGANMDILSYTYNGNQLLKVDDTGDKTKGFIDGANTGNDFVYDVNGNMTADSNKGITSITYNHLNIPVQVTKNSNEKMIYIYDATGKKLSQQVYSAGGALIKTTDYVGDLIYQNDTLQFINNADGRVVMKTGTPEYQYHLKDHWGNVRVTFTSQATVKTYTAGFEMVNQTTEASNFSNYPTVAKINTVATNAHSGSNSLYLNGSTSGGQIGVTKSFSVMPGDQVSIQAYAKYNAPTSAQSNLAGFATALLSAFNLSTPVSGETGTARSAINEWGAGEAAAFGDGSTDNTDPKVFVNILVFDRNFSFLDISYQQLTSSGVMNASYTVKQAGYIYVYVSNEQPVLTDVYFDDITVTYTPSPIVQQEDFYPFGLTFDSYQRQSTIPNKYLFHNKTEFIDDIGLNWYHFRYRMEDPALGRFMCVDPLAEKYVYNSPYAFGENKLGMGIELEGLELSPFYNPPPPPPAAGWHPPMTSEYKTISPTQVVNTYTGNVVKERQYDLPGGQNLPSKIETKDAKGNSVQVTVSFGTTPTDNHTSDNKIHPSAVKGFISAIQKANEMGAGISTLEVTATTNGSHKGGWSEGSSNHFKALAVDIGLVNGSRPTASDSLVQQAGDKVPGINENYGPKFDHKQTQTVSDQKHTSWIHFSFQE